MVVIASLVLSAFWALWDSAGANAAPAVRPDPPSAGAAWGVATATWSTTPIMSETGGWRQRQYAAISGTTTLRSVELKLSEPYRHPTLNEMSIALTATGMNDYQNTPSVAITVGYSALIQSVAVCQNTEWATSSFTVTTFGSFSGSILANGEMTKTVTTGFANPRSGCPYLRTLRYTITVQANGGLSAQTQQAVWNSEDFYNDKKYNDKPIEEVLCKGPTASAYLKCQGIIDADPTDYCNGAPVMEDVTDVGWFGEAIEFYSQCLFNPLGGWDRKAEIEPAVKGSAIGKLNSSATQVANAFKYNTVCGVLFTTQGNSKIKVPMTINTCSWTAWSAPFKSFAGIIIGTGFGIWALLFIAKSINAVAAGGKAPTPLSDGSDD